MSIRSQSQRGSSPSRTATKMSRLREKAIQLKNRIKQADLAFLARRDSRMAWWQRVFKTPLLGYSNWICSKATSLWAAFMALLGFNTKSWSASAVRRPVTVRHSLLRSVMLEGLEQRQLMAFDFTAMTSPGTFVDSPGAGVDTAVVNATPVNFTVTVADGNSDVVYDANGDNLVDTVVPLGFGAGAKSFAWVGVFAPGTYSYQEVAAGSKVVGNPMVADEVLTLTLDTTPPSLTITDTVPGTANIATGAITYTFDFSEPVTGFDASDVAVLNGTKGAFATVNSSKYTLSVTPTASFEGTTTVSVSAGAANDAATNGNTSASNLQPVDTKAPTINGPFTRSVAENSPASTAVGAAFTASESVTFSEVGGTGAAQFNISGAGQITTAGTTLDFEATPSFSFDFIATDTAGNPSSPASSAAISLTDVVESFPGSFAGNAILRFEIGDGKLHLRTLPGLVDITPPHLLASLSSPITLTGTSAADSLTVDIASLPAGLQIVYDGGAGGADDLKIIDSSATLRASVTHSFTNNNDGSVAVSSGPTIAYTGLEPITDNLSATDRVFTFNGAAETIDLINSPVGGFTHRIDSTLGESVDFNMPTSSLTINAGINDVLNIAKLNSVPTATLNAGTVSSVAGASIVVTGLTTINSDAGGVNLTLGSVNLGSLTVNGAAGAVSVSETSGVVINTVSGTAVTLSSTGAITDGNAAATNVTSTSLLPPVQSIWIRTSVV
jgi:Bacterial Ig-like domain